MPNETKNDRRWLALLILCAGFLMIVLDMTIVNVALPSIKNDLGFSQASLAWVVNAYLIAYAGVLLLAGRLGDLIGRKRIFLIGLVAFTAASMVCGLSVSQPMLIAARFLPLTHITGVRVKNHPAGSAVSDAGFEIVDRLVVNCPAVAEHANGQH